MNDNFNKKIEEYENYNAKKKLIIFMVLLVIVLVLILFFVVFKKENYITSVEALEERGLKVIYKIGNNTSWYDYKGNCFIDYTNQETECNRINPNSVDSLNAYNSTIAITNGENVLSYDFSNNDLLEFASFSYNNTLNYYFNSDNVVVFINDAYNSCYYSVEGNYISDLMDKCDNNRKNEIDDVYNNYKKFIDEYHIDVNELPIMIKSFIDTTISDKVVELKNNITYLTSNEIGDILSNYENFKMEKNNNEVNISISEEESIISFTLMFDKNGNTTNFIYSLEDMDFINKEYTYDITNSSEYLSYKSNSYCKLYMDIYYESKGVTPNAIGCSEDEKHDLENYSLYVVEEVFNRYGFTIDELISYMNDYYNNKMDIND